MEDLVIVLITCPSLEIANNIAGRLVTDRLAACVNIIEKVQSIFQWQNAVDQASECLLIIKTKKKGFKLLCDRVLKLHPYQTPEVIALPIIDGSPEYLNWIAEETI
ncbi:MAG: divalent-cation tolerance protein CutA [Calditrichaeota bacterium]|nr:MAG: divalent-cation tolerance protein CutA [Calditrichota bacterium]